MKSDDSPEKFHTLKAWIDSDTVEGHFGLSTVYNEQKWFQFNKLGRDIQIQISNNVHPSFCRGVIQITTLNAQMGLGWDLVDWS